MTAKTATLEERLERIEANLERLLQHTVPTRKDLLAAARTLASILGPLGFLEKNPQSLKRSERNPKWDQLLNRLASFPQLQEDWEEQGAKLPDSETLDLANRWIDAVWQAGLVPPTVSPGNLGEVIFEWRTDNCHIVLDLPDLTKTRLSIFCKPSLSQHMEIYF